MTKLIDEYKTILVGKALPSEKFWDFDEHIKKDKKSPGVSICGLSRSSMLRDMSGLGECKVITLEYLEGFIAENAAGDPPRNCLTKYPAASDKT